MASRRVVAIILSAVLALVLAAQVAYAQPASASKAKQTSLGALTASWWDWAMQDPTPLEGSYIGTTKCDGEYVDGTFFLGGAAAVGGAPSSVERTCTVPAKMPILFPVVNVVCSEAWGVAGQVPPDPEPYDTACAEPITNDTIDPPSTFYATVDGKDARQVRVASGVFQWTIASDENPFGLYAGTYPAASDGL